MCKMWSSCDHTCSQDDCPQMSTMMHYIGSLAFMPNKPEYALAKNVQNHNNMSLIILFHCKWLLKPHVSHGYHFSWANYFVRLALQIAI